jgi:crotonobetainyl-CoA:carnitine CoA-transferase CaiB-like acyl-CoA transferase
MSGPLAGIKVVEVAIWAFVPSCGGMLSDMGADVIKVEPPAGDPVRGLSTGGVGPGAQGFTVQWEIYNRGKRSITIDLAVEGAVEVLHRLLEDADVFLTNLLPQTRRKLKIDVDDIRARHPDIIYAVGSGQGAFGPDAEKGGYDFISFWSRGGVSAAVTPPDYPYPLPMPSGAFGDCTSGAMFAAGIAAAIAQRALTGKTSVVDGSLLASSMWSMQSKISSVTLAGVPDLPKPGRTAPYNPLVNCYRTADQRYLVLCMLQAQRYWPGLCHALGRPDLVEDPRFDGDASRTRNMAECVAALDEVFATKTLDEWRPILASQPGQWDVVQLPGDVHRDVQVLANHYMQEVAYDDGRVLKMVSVPVQFDRQPLKPRPAPELGADSDAVLAELGYDEDQIIDLKVAGIVF